MKQDEEELKRVEVVEEKVEHKDEDNEDAKKLGRESTKERIK